MMNIRKETGFNLIELMLVVALLAILAAIAYPTYEQYIQRVRRADCESVLMSAAALLERKHSVVNKYATADLDLPAKCPQEGTRVFYNIKLDPITDSAFTFTATPVGAQTADVCGTLTLTHTGEKDATGGVAGCW
jgi:type IV pilus assembly protein PilE